MLCRVGGKIRWLRQARSLSQEQLADKAGMHMTFIGKVERGTVNVSLLSLEKIAGALNEPLAALLDSEDETEIHDKNAQMLVKTLRRIADETKSALSIAYSLKMKR